MNLIQHCVKMFHKQRLRSGLRTSDVDDSPNNIEIACFGYGCGSQYFTSDTQAAAGETPQLSDIKLVALGLVVHPSATDCHFATLSLLVVTFCAFNPIPLKDLERRSARGWYSTSISDIRACSEPLVQYEILWLTSVIAIVQYESHGSHP